ncbi:hypothetical protein SASPL_138000 [Salvia splendens]|uniref:Uncharacterized protein n=1 Tax=Salvia splendens TaxID=180675 RepID=A0A8X8WVV1_SALSN|nr:hypothetical protein SASPL_138000 [Salvia splendens]
MKEDDFRLGRVVSQYDENELGSAKMSTGVEHPASTEDVVENRDGSEELVYMKGVWGAVEHIGYGFKLLAKELNQAPQEIRKTDSFRITCDTLRRAFRLDDNDVDPVESMTQTQSAQCDAAEDWMVALVTVIQSVARKQTCQTIQPMLKRCSQEGERETAAELGGDCLDFMTGSEIGREHVSVAKVGTVVNEENALDVAMAIVRDVEAEHDEVDIAICSAVEAVYELGDAAFETQIVTRGVDKGKLPVCGDAESYREESTFADIQPAPVNKMRLPTGRRQGSMSTRISPLWTREERDCYQFLLATLYMWMDHVVYDDDMVELSKRKFSTLKPHEAVDVGVVDAWAWYLNRMEEEKSTQNPRRLFATKSPTTFNVVERRTSWVESEAAHSFCEEMDGQFNMDGNFDFTKYDLTGVVDVLDIVVPENGIPDATKYGRDLGLLKTTHTTNDSAIFLMRHMEAYKGNLNNLKAIGLQGASVRILHILRGRYCKNMLLAPFNIAKEKFLSYMSHYINVTPTFRTDYARQVNGMLNKAPSNEQCNQPVRKRSKMK